MQLFKGVGGYPGGGRRDRETDQLRPTLPVATRSAARLIELNDLRRAARFGAFPAFFEPEFELELPLGPLAGRLIDSPAAFWSFNMVIRSE